MAQMANPTVNQGVSAGYLGQTSNVIGNSAQPSLRSSSASFTQAPINVKPGFSHLQSVTMTHNQSLDSNQASAILESERSENIHTNSSLQRERVYVEKIKQLKSENKKLIALLRDSEKLFYQKLKETKKESENLSALFKQLWPLIKSKVKDPNSLLKSVMQGGETHEFPNEELEELRREIEQLKQNEKKLLEDLRVEREFRLFNELQLRRTFNKMQEMRAFQ